MGAHDKTITLSDGREITVDITTLLEKEWRGFYNADISDDESDGVIARVCGVEREYISDLLNDDFRRVFSAIEELAHLKIEDRGDVILSDKKKIEVDVSTLKRREYKELFQGRVVGEKSDAVVARLCNVKTAYIQGLTHIDYRLIFDRIVFLSNSPLDDPNSPSAST